MTLPGTKRPRGCEPDDTGRYCVELGGTSDLYLLIRVSQVRDLYGSPYPLRPVIYE